MKRSAKPVVSALGEQFLCTYEQMLWTQEDLTSVSIHNSLSDLRHFVAWYEQKSMGVQEDARTFTPNEVATPTITQYRAYLQRECLLKPTSVNRTLISLKHYFGWWVEEKLPSQNTAKGVKLVEQEELSPHHLSDQKERGLVAAVTTSGSVRDRTLILLLLHTGLRAREACTLRRDQVQMGKRSGLLRVTGKRNTYREVLLNSKVQAALLEYLPTLSGQCPYLFSSVKTTVALTERALGYIVTKYACRASLVEMSPHDLRHRFGYRMAEAIPLHRLAQIMGHDSLDTTRIYVQGAKQDLQHVVEITESLESDTRLTHTRKQTSIPSFPIVGIGASAGGLEAFTHLLEHLPATTGMAYVLVQHLDPTHKSLLADLLVRATRMKVCEAREGMEVCANHVYIIAPNTDLTLEQSSLRLVPQTKTAGQHLSIDTLLASLAENAQHQAIGVILSGTGSDGTRGLQAIKERGGITLAQDAPSAQYSAMPQSAIAAGCVDFIGSPANIARELTRISHLSSVLPANVARDQEGTEDTASFQQILRLLSLRTDVDFTLYKPTMLMRRVQRRMGLSQIDRAASYLTYLRDHQAEVAALLQDFLIGVTAFFRNPATEQALIHEVFPRLTWAHSSPDPLRIWVPGCSTGEEVYSLAICLQEFLSERSDAIPFQIFGTDLNGTAIEQARKGIYAPGALGGVSLERRERFFLPVSGNALVSTSIRECCVFAQHNLLKDPPFSHLDLLSCQNVLIYLGPDAQKKSFQLFHYALSLHGFLLLGPSETIGTASDLFAHTGQHQHLYLKKATSVRSWFVGDVRGLARGKPSDLSEEGNNMRIEESIRAFDIQKETDRLLLARYAPASVVIDAEMEILQFRGPIHPYLQPASGKASFNLFKMARESLEIELRTAISKARKSGQPVKKGGIQMKDQGVLHEVQVEVIPVQASAAEYYFVIVFEEMPTIPSTPGVPTQVAAQQTERATRSVKDRRIQHLEREVETTREQMHAIIEELETANEELQSANEEILSSNEELQSLNEELETSKEEVQASNEELLVVNQELKQSNTQLHTAREYADAIVETIREPLLVLDADLRIQRANSAFYQFFQVEPAHTEHRLLFELEDSQWNISALRTLLEELLPTNHSFTDYTMEYLFPRIGRKTMLLNAHRIDHVPLILLAMEDITALTQAVKEKQQLLSQREEFMAIASHELKTPMTSLKGYIQLMHRHLHKTGDEQATSLLAEMDGRVNKLVTLINELLDVTTIEAGKLNWRTEVFDLDALVRDSVRDARQTAQQHQIQVEGTLPTLVLGNPEHSGQVLTNLLSNAIKYSPQAETILVTLRAEKDAATVGVQDFGIGIAPEKQAHLFERFFRVSDPEHTMFPGLGLGLYISAEIVKRQGGRMWVESRLGIGSTFFFTVPFAPQPEPSHLRHEGEEPHE